MGHAYKRTLALPGVGSKGCFGARESGRCLAGCVIGHINFSEPVSLSVKKNKYLLPQRVV